MDSATRAQTIPLRLVSIFLALAALIALLPDVARADDDPKRLTVMTRNLYVGSSYSHILRATDQASFIQGTTTFWANVQRSNFRLRARRLADEVAVAKPDLIGLQEASLFRVQVPSDPATPATNVSLDYLAILREELAARGLTYNVVSEAVAFEAEAPVLGGPTGLSDVRLTDRDVVLVRAGVRGLVVRSVHSGNYSARVVLATPVGPLAITRSWNRVDAEIGGERFRLVNTHLEPPDPAVPTSEAVQVAQANELLAGPLASSLPVIAVGDYNSAADGSTTATYGLLIGAGFKDAWTAFQPANPGRTCCQAELLDRISLPSERIDLALTRGPWKTDLAVRTGVLPFRLSPAPLWASDHFGVFSALRLAR